MKRQVLHPIYKQDINKIEVYLKHPHTGKLRLFGFVREISCGDETGWQYITTTVYDPFGGPINTLLATLQSIEDFFVVDIHREQW